jgi:hypothetical protein
MIMCSQKNIYQGAALQNLLSFRIRVKYSQ